MNSYVFDIGEKDRKASRFIGHVRTELQKALVAEKAERKITQQQIANQIGVNRSVINRQLMGTENLTLRSVAELAWALGWEIDFTLRKQPDHGNDQQHVDAMQVSAGCTPLHAQVGETLKDLDNASAHRGIATESKPSLKAALPAPPTGFGGIRHKGAPRSQAK